jgi:hypothetical protein
MVGWKKAGEDITFSRSKINDLLGFKPRKEYSQVSFTYDFTNNEEDTTYFAYSFPYSFTKIH